MDVRGGEALERLVAGVPFAAICRIFDDLPPRTAAEHVSAVLARWVEDGILAATI
jgi:hypothetical protein